MVAKIPKDHKGLYACEPFNHGVETKISNDKDMVEQRRIDWEGDKYPETVTLKAEGDIIEGVITEIGEIRLEDRLASYIRLMTAKGERTFWLGKVLSEEVVRESVKKGDYVGIKYLGEKPSHKGNPYKDYDMRVIPTEVIEEEG